MAVDVLRSCHRSVWRFYANAPHVVTHGRFYFLPKNAPALPYMHNFYSATWTHDDDQSPDRLGPVQDAERRWFNGNLNIGFPPAIPIGDPLQFSGELNYPSDVNTGILRSGILEKCWTVPHVPFLPFDEVSDLNNCCIRLMYARIIDLLYQENFADVTTFFEAWLGAGVTVTHYDVNGILPSMVFVQSATYVIVVISGTTQFQQLALQGFTGLQGPVDMGGFGTGTLWFNLGTYIAEKLLEIGVSDPLPILFAGHSYGGAGAATLAVRMRQAHAKRQIKLLTFGMPKPGDSRFVNTLALCECVHVHNTKDIVSQVPPSALQSVWFPLLIGNVLAASWNQWEYPAQWIIQEENGDHQDDVLPSLLFDTLLPLVINAVLLQPITPIEPHTIAAYIRRMQLGCNCPEYPFDHNIWIILFPVDFPLDGVDLSRPVTDPIELTGIATTEITGELELSPIIADPFELFEIVRTEGVVELVGTIGETEGVVELVGTIGETEGVVELVGTIGETEGVVELLGDVPADGVVELLGDGIDGEIDLEPEP